MTKTITIKTADALKFCFYENHHFIRTCNLRELAMILKAEAQIFSEEALAEIKKDTEKIFAAAIEISNP